MAVLVEEFITKQRMEFNLKGLYSYIVYWGMEEKRIEGDQLSNVDKEKVNAILNRIIEDGRISAKENCTYIKQ